MTKKKVARPIVAEFGRGGTISVVLNIPAPQQSNELRALLLSTHEVYVDNAILTVLKQCETGNQALPVSEEMLKHLLREFTRIMHRNFSAKIEEADALTAREILSYLINQGID